MYLFDSQHTNYRLNGFLIVFAAACVDEVQLFPAFDDTILTCRKKQLFTNIQRNQTFHSIPVTLSKGSGYLAWNNIVTV